MLESVAGHAGCMFQQERSNKGETLSRNPEDMIVRFAMRAIQYSGTCIPRNACSRSTELLYGKSDDHVFRIPACI